MTFDTPPPRVSTTGFSSPEQRPAFRANSRGHPLSVSALWPKVGFAMQSDLYGCRPSSASHGYHRLVQARRQGLNHHGLLKRSGTDARFGARRGRVRPRCLRQEGINAEEQRRKNREGRSEERRVGKERRNV